MCKGANLSEAEQMDSIQCLSYHTWKNTISIGVAYFEVNFSCNLQYSWINREHNNLSQHNECLFFNTWMENVRADIRVP